MAACSQALPCSQQLGELVAAYNRILTGGGVQEVEINGDRTRYFNGNLQELKTAIARLHAVCGNALSGAIVGQPGGRRAPAGVCYGESHRCC